MSPVQQQQDYIPNLSAMSIKMEHGAASDSGSCLTRHQTKHIDYILLGQIDTSVCISDIVLYLLLSLACLHLVDS